MTLTARMISFSFDRQAPVIVNASLEIAPGEIVALAGPSGCGKSTLGRLLAGYLRPRSGTVLLDGELIQEKGFYPVQLVQQTPELAVDPRWSVHKTMNEAYEPSEDQCRRFGIRDEWLRRYPNELSLGELQRVAIVRALAPGLRYLIADEITTMLDAVSQAEIWAALTEIATERRIGILAVTHSLSLADRLARRRFRLKSGRLEMLTSGGPRLDS